MTREAQEWAELIEGEKINVFDLLPAEMYGISIEDFVGAMGNAIERADIQLMKSEGLTQDQILDRALELIYIRLGWEEQKIHRDLFGWHIGIRLEKLIVNAIISFL